MREWVFPQTDLSVGVLTAFQEPVDCMRPLRAEGVRANLCAGAVLCATCLRHSALECSLLEFTLVKNAIKSSRMQNVQYVLRFFLEICISSHRCARFFANFRPRPRSRPGSTAEALPFLHIGFGQPEIAFMLSICLLLEALGP